MTKTIGREILTRTALRRREVDIPEWGGAVLVRELSIREVEECRALAAKAIDTNRNQIKDSVFLSRFRRRVIQIGWIDEEGQPILDADNESAIDDLSNEALDRIFDAITELSGMNDKSKADAEKNS